MSSVPNSFAPLVELSSTEIHKDHAENDTPFPPGTAKQKHLVINYRNVHNGELHPSLADVVGQIDSKELAVERLRTITHHSNTLLSRKLIWANPLLKCLHSKAWIMSTITRVAKQAARA